MSKYNLMSVSADHKTVKGEKSGYLTGILYLSPSDSSGVNICPKAGDCKNWCLAYSGNGNYPIVVKGRLRKTKLFLENYEFFISELKKDIKKLQKEASEKDLIPCVRVNGTSDQPGMARTLAKAFPDVQFYDYTKIPQPQKRVTDNYHLTFSFDTYGESDNWDDCSKALGYGINIAVAFKNEVPKTFRGYPVIDGDENDLRFKDPKGVIVGLKFKQVKKIEGRKGFVQ